MATTKNEIYYPNDGTQPADVLTDMKNMAESIDKALDKNKFDPTQIEQNMKNLQTSQLKQDSEIEELNQDVEASMLKNMTEKETSLYINDASGARGKLSIFGNIKQETTKGLQILQDTNEGTKGWTMSFGSGNYKLSSLTENGIDCVKAMCTENCDSYRVLYRKNANLEKLKNNTDYTIQLDIKMNKIGQLGLSLRNLDSSNVLLDFGNLDYTEANVWQTFKVKATSNDIEINGQVVYIALDAINEVNNYVAVRNLILVEGNYSNENLEWEKYTGVEQMPNLNYPSPIQALKDSTDITFSNKNLVPVLTANSNYLCRCKKGDIFSIQLKGTSASDTRVEIRTYDGEFNDNLNSYVDQKWLQADGTEQTATITSSIDGFVYLRLARRTRNLYF